MASDSPIFNRYVTVTDHRGVLDAIDEVFEAVIALAVQRPMNKGAPRSGGDPYPVARLDELLAVWYAAGPDTPSIELVATQRGPDRAHTFHIEYRRASGHLTADENGECHALVGRPDGSVIVDRRFVVADPGRFVEAINEVLAALSA